MNLKKCSHIYYLVHGMQLSENPKLILTQTLQDFNKVDMEEPLPDSPEALTAKQEAAIREQMLLDMAPIHEKILAEIEEVLTFEDGIKRPYFHVKELERCVKCLFVLSRVYNESIVYK